MVSMTRRKADWKYKQRVKNQRWKLTRHPELAVCWICGSAINMELHYTHPDAFTLDHVVPIANGGRLHGETKPAHRRCNSARGNGHKHDVRTLADW